MHEQFTCREANPVFELSSALYDLAAGAGDMSESDDDTYSSHPTDLLMLEKAQSLCQSALQNSGIVPPTATMDPGVLSWLQRSKLVDVFGNGDICLSRDLMKHGTAVSGDVLERTTRQDSTTLEVQQDLLNLGWTLVDDFRDASILRKNACVESPSSYFSLLMEHADRLTEYESNDMFHHKQSEQYYKTFEVAPLFQPDQLEEIPTYKPVAFYNQLQSFWMDETSNDPRDEFERKPRIGHSFPFKRVYGLRFQVCVQFHCWNFTMFLGCQPTFETHTIRIH